MTHPPTYFTHLRPFISWFEEGWPILTYHKVGPSPPGVRLRGLYLSESRFRKQMKELRSAGFKTVSLDDTPSPGSTRPLSISLTLDDGFEKVFYHALAPLAEFKFRATMFLVADRLGGINDWEVAEGECRERLMETGQIREWLAAGQEIGSHTCQHPWLTRIPAEQAREEILSSKKKLEDCFGKPVQHFCYPYGDYNRAVADLVAEAGYSTACTTRTGLNTPGTPRHELYRITTRYRSWSMRQLKQWLARWMPLDRSAVRGAGLSQ